MGSKHQAVQNYECVLSLNDSPALSPFWLKTAISVLTSLNKFENSCSCSAIAILVFVLEQGLSFSVVLLLTCCTSLFVIAPTRVSSSLVELLESHTFAYYLQHGVHIVRSSSSGYPGRGRISAWISAWFFSAGQPISACAGVRAYQSGIDGHAWFPNQCRHGGMVFIGRYFQLGRPVA